MKKKLLKKKKVDINNISCNPLIKLCKIFLDIYILFIVS